MIEGIFGQVEAGRVIGWAFDSTMNEPVTIIIKNKKKVIAEGVANLERNDLKEVASHLGGKAGFKIRLPKGRKNWTNIEVYANDVMLPKAPQLQLKIKQTHRTLLLKMEEPHFFIHIPKTAGTAFKKLLEDYFDHDDIFPSNRLVLNNKGMYPHFDEIIKWESPEVIPRLMLGHYPYATQQMIKGKVSKTVILRDPVQRAISNIFHMKNNDPRMKKMNPMEIYRRGNKNYVNFQIRYLTDKGINLNMRFIDAKPLTQKDLTSAIANLRKCEVVGISDQLERTVALTNKVYNWDLKTPKRVNIAKSDKKISDELYDLIVKDNALEQKLFTQAINRFEKLCEIHGVTD